jgi:hypothetical protein
VPAIVSVALLATACGGSPSAAGSGGSSSAGSASSSSGVAYSRCMRAHGVPDFPDPGAGGQISKSAVIRAFRQVSDSTANSASARCASLNPAGQASPVLTSGQRQDYLRAAACMRAHGFPGFPDPTFPGGRLSLSIPSSIDTASAPFEQAARTCTRLIPAGLRYGRRGGR